MPDQKLSFNLSFPVYDVHIRPGIHGLDLALKDGQTPLLPGAPAIPVRHIDVALPDGMEVKRASARVMRVRPLTSTPAYVTPGSSRDPWAP